MEVTNFSANEMSHSKQDAEAWWNAVCRAGREKKTVAGRDETQRERWRNTTGEDVLRIMTGGRVFPLRKKEPSVGETLNNSQLNGKATSSSSKLKNEKSLFDHLENINKKQQHDESNTYQCCRLNLSKSNQTAVDNVEVTDSGSSVFSKTSKESQPAEAVGSRDENMNPTHVLKQDKPDTDAIIKKPTRNVKHAGTQTEIPSETKSQEEQISITDVLHVPLIRLLTGEHTEESVKIVSGQLYDELKELLTTILTSVSRFKYCLKSDKATDAVLQAIERVGTNCQYDAQGTSTAVRELLRNIYSESRLLDETR